MSSNCTYRVVRCPFCEWQPFIDDDTGECPSCKSTLREAARFYSECGAHLTEIPKNHIEP